MKVYSAASVKKEFNADQGYMYLGPVGPSYSQIYTYGFFMVLHKDFTGNAFVTYLFKDQKTMLDQMPHIVAQIFKILKFKD